MHKIRVKINEYITPHNIMIIHITRNQLKFNFVLTLLKSV